MNYTTSNECIFSICAYSARRLDTSSYKYVYDGDLGDPKDIIQNMIVITGGEIEQLGFCLVLISLHFEDKTICAPVERTI